MSRPSLKDPGILLATWFGLGYLKPAPGTWGSLGALPFGLALLHFGGLIALCAGIVVITAIGFWASGIYDQNAKAHDSSEIVIDEVAGQWIALLPCVFVGITPITVLLSFLLFRAFDIIKPWPISFLDKRVEGPLGVMADDLLAGIFAALTLYGVITLGNIG